jgi:hypothetical protein
MNRKDEWKGWVPSPTRTDAENTDAPRISVPITVESFRDLEGSLGRVCAQGVCSGRTG